MKLAENLKRDIVVTGGDESLGRVQDILSRLEVENRFLVKILYLGIKQDALEEAIKYLDVLAKSGELSKKKHVISLNDFIVFRDRLALSFR